MKTLLSVIFIFMSSFLFSIEVTFLLIRHGETDWNVEKRIQGHTDIPLNAKGREQAQETAKKLAREHADIKAIYSSDLSRAYSTALETAQKFQLPVHSHSSLREGNMGVAEGLQRSEKKALYQDKLEELEQKYPNRGERWKHSAIPNEETIHVLVERIKKQLVEIAQNHPSEKVAIFSHARAIRSFLSDIEDCSPEEFSISNCAIIEVHYDSTDVQRPFRLTKIH